MLHYYALYGSRRLRRTHLKMRRMTLVNASLKPMSDVSWRDMDANNSPPKNKSVKISTYTGFKAKGAAGGAPGGPEAAPGVPMPAAAAVLPGSGTGLLPLLFPCATGPEETLEALDWLNPGPLLGACADVACPLCVLLLPVPGLGAASCESAAVSAAAEHVLTCLLLLHDRYLKELMAQRPRLACEQAPILGQATCLTTNDLVTNEEKHSIWRC